MTTHHLATAAGALVSSFLPNVDPVLRLVFGTATSSIVASLLSWCSNHAKTRFQAFKCTPQLYLRYDDGPLGVLYIDFRRWLLEQGLNEVQNAQLCVTPEGLHLTPRSGTQLEKNGFTIRFVTPPKEGNDEDAPRHRRLPDIVIEKKGSSMRDMFEFVVGVTRTPTLQSRLRIHSVKLIGKRKTRACWETSICRTNKSPDNCIFSETVQEEFLEDVSAFINDERLYASRGLPYKRGYLLYGPPGTGKTSAVQVAAIRHNMEIFTIDSSMKLDPSTLLSLFIELRHVKKGKHHVLLFEDFEPHWTMAKHRTTFLNLLDGVCESYGQILVFTCNDFSWKNHFPALLRPGRIDREINVTHCTDQQALQILRMYYGQDAPIPPDFKLQERLTPSRFMQKLQTSKGLESFLSADAGDAIDPTPEPTRKRPRPRQGPTRAQVALRKLKLDAKQLEFIIDPLTVEEKRLKLKRLKQKIAEKEEIVERQRARKKRKR